MKRISICLLRSFTRFSPGTIMRQNYTSCKMVPTSLVTECEGLAQSELGWPLDRKRPQHRVAISFTWFDSFEFLSVESYQGQGLCVKLPKLGRPQELTPNTFSRSDGRKCVSKHEELGEEIDNGDGACCCSHQAINYSWEN